jgi:hypothetical protein
MYGGPHVSFSFGFTFGVTNLIYVTNGSDIFVNDSRNDELFNGYYSISEIFEFPPLECNLNLFDHFLILTSLSTLKSSIFLQVHILH